MPERATTKTILCRICECRCGLVMTVEGARASPDRVTAPLARVGDGDEPIAGIGAKVRAIPELEPLPGFRLEAAFARAQAEAGRMRRITKRERSRYDSWADATPLSVASRTTGVDANVRALDGRDAIEPGSGRVPRTGIAVDARPAGSPSAS